MSNNESNGIIITHNATNSYDKVYDLLMQGIRDRFLNPGASLSLKLRGSEVSDFTDLLLSKVYDTIEYISSLARKHGREPESSITYLEDDPFDRAMYRNMLDEDIGSIGLSEFIFVERRIIDQLDALKTGDSKRMAKKERHIRRPSKDTLDIQRFKTKKVRYSNIAEHPKASIVSELYNVDIQKLKFDQLRYYFTKPLHQYLPYDRIIENLIIDPYDYIRSLRAGLAKHNDRSYYAKLLDDPKLLSVLSKAHTDRKRIDHLEIDESTMDFLATTYIRYRPNAFVFTVWDPAIKYVDELLAELESTGSVYYVKKLELDYATLEGVMFWMYDEFSFPKRHDFITKKLDYIGASKNGKSQICVIVYDNINKMSLAGQASRYKTQIRNLLLDKVDPQKKNYRGNDLLHVNDYNYQAIEYSQNYFNRNTLRMYSNQDRSLFLKESNTKSNLILQTYRAFLYQNLPYDEIDRLFTMGSMSLYAHGIRRNTDIDSVMVDSTSISGSPGLVKKIEHYFSDKRTRFNFADIGVMGSESWNPNWTDKNNEWFKRIEDGPQDAYDMASNPAHYFYFQGIKVTLLDYEVVRKLMRFEIHDVLDLLVMNLMGVTSHYYELVPQDKIDDIIKTSRTRSIAPIATKNFDARARGIHGKNWAMPDLINQSDDSDKDGLIKYVTQAMHKRYDSDQIDEFMKDPSIRLLLIAK